MDRIEGVRRLLDDLPRRAEEHVVPGVSVAVLVDGQVVERACGVVNLRTGVEVTPDTLFMIQSITKVWTATLVMQLVDDGLLALDDRVRDHLPGFRTSDEGAAAQVTVRHLLTHTGGFEGDLWAPTTCGDDALQRFVDDVVAGAAQHAEPGELYSYCSAGFGVLGRLVEVLRGLPYPAALRRHLAEPLGTEEIAFSADEALSFRTAIGHASPGGGRPERPLRRWAVMPPSNHAAGNQLAMSARALLAFGRLHVDGGLTADGTRVLSAASVQAMQERQLDRPVAAGAPNGQGLGWMLDARPGLVGHGGGSIGVSALLQLAPEQGVALAVLANGEGAGPVMEGLLDVLLDDLGVTGRPPTPAPAAPTAGPEPARCAGTYRTRTALSTVTVEDDGRMWLTVDPRNEALAMAADAGVAAESQRLELRHAHGDTFDVVGPDGSSSGTVAFVGADSRGRARFLHTGRAAPRVD